MIFDEVHHSKSAYKSIKPSRTGLGVMHLQYGFPKSRVVYSSATAASEIHHLLVFPRLELWGNGTPFKDYKEFRNSMNQRYQFQNLILVYSILLTHCFLLQGVSRTGAVGYGFEDGRKDDL